MQQTALPQSPPPLAAACIFALLGFGRAEEVSPVAQPSIECWHAHRGRAWLLKEAAARSARSGAAASTEKQASKAAGSRAGNTEHKGASQEGEAGVLQSGLGPCGELMPL